MFDVNKVQLIGYAGNDPACNMTVDGTPMCRFSIATTIPYVKANGDHGTKTNWHNIVVFGNQAKTISSKIKKGSRCKVLGYIDHVEKKRDDGAVDRYTNIIASSVDICTGRSNGNHQDDVSDDYVNYACCVAMEESERQEPVF